MRVEYDEINNCYTADIQIKLEKSRRYVDAVIDTGATNTAIAVDILVGSTDEKVIEKVTNKLQRHAQEAGVRRAVIRSAAKESDATEIYAYDACFDNVVVGGHLMKKFRARIMLNGAKGVCVIGNDFLNMCKYYHDAGEHQLTVENPVEQRYYESFSGKRVLRSSQLDLLFSENTVENSVSDEDAVYAELLRKGDEIMKGL